MIDSDIREDIEILEGMANVPHCEAAHHHPEVRAWAGECTHTVVATLTCSCTLQDGGICMNTLMGFATEAARGQKCLGCKRPIRDCWKATPR